MVTFKHPFSVLLATHTVIPTASGPTGMGLVLIGSVPQESALHIMADRICSFVSKPSKAWQALGWLWPAHSYRASHCPFSSKARQCWIWEGDRVAGGGQCGGQAALTPSPAMLSHSSCPAPVPRVLIPTSIPIPHSSAQLLTFNSNPFPSTCWILWGNSQSRSLCKIRSRGVPGEIVGPSSAPGAFRLFPGIQWDDHKSLLLPPSRTFPPSLIINFLKDPINPQMEKYGGICTCAVKHIAHLFQMDVAIYKTYLGHEPGFMVFKQGSMM